MQGCHFSHATIRLTASRATTLSFCKLTRLRKQSWGVSAHSTICVRRQPRTCVDRPGTGRPRLASPKLLGTRCQGRPRRRQRGLPRHSTASSLALLHLCAEPQGPPHTPKLRLELDPAVDISVEARVQGEVRLSLLIRH